MKNIIVAAVAALLMSGCASKTPIVIDDVVKQKEGVATLVITAPQNQYVLGSALSSFTNYDYYLNCLEDSCRVARMHAIQYVVAYAPAGKHTLYAVPKDTNLFDKASVLNMEPVALEFEAMVNKKNYITHEWNVISMSILLPFIAKNSTHLKVSDDAEGIERIQKVEHTVSMTGEKLSGFGERGETFGQ